MVVQQTVNFDERQKSGWRPDIRIDLEQPIYPIKRSSVFQLSAVGDNYASITVVIDQTITF